ncbi:hypothetical protein KCU77_g8696, partial [Aureobasidium melanogenum]
MARYVPIEVYERHIELYQRQQREITDELHRMSERIRLNEERTRMNAERTDRVIRGVNNVQANMRFVGEACPHVGRVAHNVLRGPGYPAPPVFSQGAERFSASPVPGPGVAEPQARATPLNNQQIPHVPRGESRENPIDITADNDGHNESVLERMPEKKRNRAKHATGSDKPMKKRRQGNNFRGLPRQDRFVFGSVRQQRDTTYQPEAPVDMGDLAQRKNPGRSSRLIGKSYFPTPTPFPEG